MALHCIARSVISSWTWSFIELRVFAIIANRSPVSLPITIFSLSHEQQVQLPVLCACVCLLPNCKLLQSEHGEVIVHLFIGKESQMELSPIESQRVHSCPAYFDAHLWYSSIFVNCQTINWMRLWFACVAILLLELMVYSGLNDALFILLTSTSCISFENWATSSCQLDTSQVPFVTFLN